MEWVNQPWMSTESKPWWREFIALTPEEREAALEHTLKVKSPSSSAGWQSVTVTLDGVTGHYYFSSWLSGDYREFVNTVEELGPREELSYIWEREPGCYVWTLSRRYDLIYVAPPGLAGVIMRWDALLDALDDDRIIEEKYWWTNWGYAARDEDEGYDWVNYLLGEVQTCIRTGQEYDWEVTVKRTPEGIGWRGETWDFLTVTVGPQMNYYYEAGMDVLAEAVRNLDPKGGTAQIWGISRPWAHGYFFERRGSFVAVESPLLEGTYGDWFVCYEDLRQALCGGSSNGGEVRSAIRDYARFQMSSEPLLNGRADEFWSAFDALSAEARELRLDRYCVTEAEIVPIEDRAGSGGLTRLSFRLEDTTRHDRMEDLWMQALSAEAPDETVYMLNKYEQYVLSEDYSYWQEAPREMLEKYVKSICALEDGGVLLIGKDDGIVIRRPDGRELLLGNDGFPQRHRWVVARHGEVMLLDSTLLEDEAFVSRDKLLAALEVLF